MNFLPKMIASLQDGSNTLLAEASAEVAWAWGKVAGFVVGVGGAVGGGILTFVRDDAMLGLLVALVSLYVALRAFWQDRMGTITGLSILTHSSPEYVPQVKDGQTVGWAHSSYLIVEMLARGPGTRYEVRGAVWAPENTVVTDVQTPELETWRAGDASITITLRRDREHRTPWKDKYWQDVYVGAVWSRPSTWRGRFVVEGMRVKVPAPNSRQPEDEYQTWSRWRGRWVDRKRLKMETGGRLDGAVKAGRTLAQQSIDRHPAEPDPILKYFGTVNESTKRFRQ